MSCTVFHRIWLVLCLVLPVCENISQASSCSEAPDDQLFKAAKHVFRGRIDSITVPKDHEVNLGFLIEKSYKGKKKGKIRAEYSDRFGPKDISGWFKTGVPSIVFVFDSAGTLSVRSCGPAIFPLHEEHGRKLKAALEKRR